MEFPNGVTLYRHRRKQIVDPYNPGKTTADSWSDVEKIPLPGAFIGSSSTSRFKDGTRAQLLGEKSLYLTDVALDVKPGDRIGSESVATFAVDGIPSADTNPFTGWQPVKEIPLEEVQG